MTRDYLRHFAASNRGRAGLVSELEALHQRAAELEAALLALRAELEALKGGGSWQPVGEAWSDGTWFEDPDGRRWGWIEAAPAPDGGE